MDISFPESFLANYEPLRELGRGGMGFVVLAEKKDNEQLVAVKFLLPQFAQTVELRRFAREARLVLQLEHENIVKGLGIGGTEEDSPYLVLEYVQGGTLEHVLKTKGQVSVKDAIEIADAIGQGLVYAHAKGIFHRDIKPANILIAENGQIKISDFGLSFLARDKERLTKTGVIMGTPHYMAPEQISGGEIDGRADLYALATIVFELLAHRRPYEDEDLPSLLKAKLGKPALPLRKVAPSVSSSLAVVVDCGLRNKPGDRPRSVSKFLHALHEAKKAKHSKLGKTATRQVKAAEQATLEGRPKSHKKQSLLLALAFVALTMSIFFLWPSAKGQWKESLVVRTQNKKMVATWNSATAGSYSWSLWRDGVVRRKGVTAKSKRNHRLILKDLTSGAYTLRLQSNSDGASKESPFELMAVGVNGEVKANVALGYCCLDYEIRGLSEVQIEIVNQLGEILIGRSAPPTGPQIFKLKEHFPQVLNWSLKYKDEILAQGSISTKVQIKPWKLKQKNENSRLIPDALSDPLWITRGPIFGDNSGLLDLAELASSQKKTKGAMKRVWAYRPPDWSIHKRGLIAYALVDHNRRLLFIARHREEKNGRLWLFDINERKRQWKIAMNESEEEEELPAAFFSRENKWYAPLSDKEYRLELSSNETVNPHGLGLVVGDDVYFCTVSGPRTQIWFRWSWKKRQGHWLHLPPGEMAKAPRMLWSSAGREFDKQVEMFLRQPWHLRRTPRLLDNNLLSIVALGNAKHINYYGLCLCPTSDKSARPRVLAMFQTQKRAPWLAIFKEAGLAFITASDGLLCWSSSKQAIFQLPLDELLEDSKDHFLTGPVFGSKGQFYVCFCRLPNTLSMAKISLVAFNVSNGKVTRAKIVRGFSYEDSAIHFPTIHQVTTIKDAFLGIANEGLFYFEPKKGLFSTVKSSFIEPLRYMSCSPSGTLALVDRQCNKQLIPYAIIEGLPSIKVDG